MPSRRRSRFVALFALALALLAALPCSVLANEASCCGPSASCGDPTESPCAKLAATPCCEAGGAPIDASLAPQLPTPAEIAADNGFDASTTACGLVFPSTPPAPFRDSIAIRSIVLQL